MATSASRKSMTAEELMALRDDGNRYELSRGALICMSPSSYGPSKIAGRIITKVGSFVDRHRLGDYGTAEGGFQLASQPDTVRAPDVWFVRADRVPPAELQSKFYAGPPDLAVEVLSPSDRFNDVMQKVREYLGAGTRLVWVVDPEGRTAGVFRADGSYMLLDETGVLDGEDVLPSFTLPLRDVL